MLSDSSFIFILIRFYYFSVTWLSCDKICLFIKNIFFFFCLACNLDLLYQLIIKLRSLIGHKKSVDLILIRLYYFLFLHFSFKLISFFLFSLQSGPTPLLYQLRLSSVNKPKPIAFIWCAKNVVKGCFDFNFIVWETQTWTEGLSSKHCYVT